MYQIVILVGNLGKPPEMRYTPSGTPVTSFSLATNRKYTGSDGQVVKETTWFRVSVFGKAAEACATYLKQGSSALVEGRLNPDPKTGGPRTFPRQDGTTGTSYEIVANTVRFLSTKDGAATNASPAEMDTTAHGEEADESEIPF